MRTCSSCMIICILIHKSADVVILYKRTSFQVTFKSWIHHNYVVTHLRQNLFIKYVTFPNEPLFSCSERGVFPFILDYFLYTSGKFVIWGHKERRLITGLINFKGYGRIRLYLISWWRIGVITISGIFIFQHPVEKCKFLKY